MGKVRLGPPTELILELKSCYNILTFVETGTYLGHTASWAADNFSNVITIEWSEETYHQTALRYGNKENIDFLLGNSGNVLKQVVPKLNQPAIFWLDAHWSSGDTAGEESECPLLTEIIEINKSNYQHFVFIDDARYFLSPPPIPHSIEQWPTIDQILSTLKYNDKGYYIVIIQDVIVAVPEYAKKPVSDYCQKLYSYSNKKMNTKISQKYFELKKKIVRLLQ